MSTTLPDDITRIITNLCDRKTLFKLEITCRRLNGDFIWNSLDTFDMRMDHNTLMSAAYASRLCLWHENVSRIYAITSNPFIPNRMFHKFVKNSTHIVVHREECPNSAFSILRRVSLPRIEYLEVPFIQNASTIAGLIEKGCPNLRVLNDTAYTAADAGPVLQAILDHKPPLEELCVQIGPEYLPLLPRVAQALAPRLKKLDAHGDLVLRLSEKLTCLMDIEEIRDVCMFNLNLPVASVRIHRKSLWEGTIFAPSSRLICGPLFDECHPITPHSVESALKRLTGRLVCLESDSVTADDIQWIHDTTEKVFNMCEHLASVRDDLVRFLIAVIQVTPRQHPRVAALFQQLKRICNYFDSIRETLNRLPTAEARTILLALLKHEFEWLRSQMDFNRDRIAGNHISFHLFRHPNELMSVLTDSDFNIFSAVDASSRSPLVFCILEIVGLQIKGSVRILRYLMELYQRSAPDGAKLHQVLEKAAPIALKAFIFNKPLRKLFLDAYEGDWRTMMPPNVLQLAYQNQQFSDVWDKMMHQQQLSRFRQEISKEEFAEFEQRKWEQLIACEDVLSIFLPAFLARNTRLPPRIQMFVEGKIELQSRLPAQKARELIQHTQREAIWNKRRGL